MNPIIVLWNKIPISVKICAACIIVVIVTVMYSSWRINSLKAKLTISQDNEAALVDTTHVVKTKNGELETVRLALMADKNSLKKLSDSLALEVKIEKGKVKYIVTETVKIVHDTLFLNSTVKDSSIMWSYDHEDSAGARHLAGYSVFHYTYGKDTCGSKHITGISNKAETEITRDEMSLSIVTGLKERADKKMEIFVRSKYPGITFSKIEGAVIDPMTPVIQPPKKHFSVGPCVAVIVDPTGSIRYGIGASVQWNLFSF